MKRNPGIVAFFAIALSASACFKHTYSIGAGGNTNNSPAYSSWHGHWIFGLFGDDTINIQSICPSGNATIKDEHSFVNLIIAALVGELYYPTTVEVYCDGRTARLELSPEKLRELGRNPRLMAQVRDAEPALAHQLSAALEIDRMAESFATR
jgi:hypothetical protein